MLYSAADTERSDKTDKKRGVNGCASSLRIGWQHRWGGGEGDEGDVEARLTRDMASRQRKIPCFFTSHSNDVPSSFALCRDRPLPGIRDLRPVSCGPAFACHRSIRFTSKLILCICMNQIHS